MRDKPSPTRIIPFSLLGLCLLFGMARLLGGCQPSWKLLREAPKGSFTPSLRFAVDAWQYPTRLRIDDLPADEFFRSQRAYRRSRWKILIRWLNYDFQRSMLHHAEGISLSFRPKEAHDLLLRPLVMEIRTGQPHIQLSLPSQILLRIQVFRGNEMIEEAEFKHNTPAGLIKDKESRLRKDAYHLGKIAASYLQRRIRGLGPPED